MYTLGLSALYHDSAAALVKNGEIVAAVQEERFTRKKHDPRFPVNAIEYCLQEGHIEASQLDAVIFYENPILTIDRVLHAGIATGAVSSLTTANILGSLLSRKLWVADNFREVFGCVGRGDELLFTEHHLSHAASAFYPSPFERAAILTVDGVGEWATTTIGVGENKNIQIAQEIRFPHSLGMLYSAFTMYCGFRVNSGEYKLMGLAPYGRPKYAKIIKENLIDIKEDGSFHLNMEFFDYLTAERMIGEKFEKLFGEKNRKPESEITPHQMDVAASIQKVTEEVLLKLARHARNMTGCQNLVLAGGVALNCVANGKIMREQIFNRMWIQPAAGDAGGALGAALLAMYQHLDHPRKTDQKDSQKGCFLGPAFSYDDIQEYLDQNNLRYVQEENQDKLDKLIARELDGGMIVGLFRGRMEYGPRALGARSILGDPRQVEMQSKMNLKIKYRESFRPFAPSVLMDDCEEYFDLTQASPYMQFVAPVKKTHRKPFSMKNFCDGSNPIIEIVNIKRSDIPAVTHVDYSARIQTVDKNRNPHYYRIIDAFRKRTGCGLLVNTSFNVRGEPIVCTPQDAVRCFMNTEMDILVLEKYVLYKNQQLLSQYYDDGGTEYELD